MQAIPVPEVMAIAGTLAKGNPTTVPNAVVKYAQPFGRGRISGIDGIEPLGQRPTVVTLGGFMSSGGLGWGWGGGGGGGLSDNKHKFCSPRGFGGALVDRFGRVGKVARRSSDRFWDLETARSMCGSRC